MAHRLEDDNQDRTLMGSGTTQPVPIPAPTPYLVLLHPTDLHRRIALLRNQPVVIGRREGVDLAIADEMVSRRHCEVVWDGAHTLVHDLDSTNGTFVDGQRILRTELQPESRLQIGGAILKIDFKEAAELALDKQLYEAATLDALTRISNRRHLHEKAAALIAGAHRFHRWVHVLLLDVDFFKRVNDTYGHPAGDFVLREVAEILRREKREEDLLGRWGGEEFVLVVGESAPEPAIAFAERLRLAVERHRFVWEGTRIPITISMGICGRHDRMVSNLDDLVSRADAALYRAKQSGRNRVEIAD